MYKCSKCGAVFLAASGAETCEKNHIIVGKVQEEHYTAQDKYPKTIVVEGDDGTSIKYEYVCHAEYDYMGTPHWVYENDIT